MSLAPCNHSFCKNCIIFTSKIKKKQKKSSSKTKIKRIKKCPVCEKTVQDINSNPEIYAVLELERNGKLACVWDCGFEYLEIIAHKRDENKNIFYKVSWKSGEQTWQPFSDFSQDDDIFNDYNKIHDL